MSLADQTLPSDTFVRRLRAERERQNLSQAQLAREMAKTLGVNVDPSAVTRIEQQTRTVRLDEAVAMSDVLQVPLAALLMDDSDDDNEAAIQGHLVELMAAHHRWEEARQEVDRLSRTIQALSGGYGLYMHQGSGDELDAEWQDAIDARVRVDDGDAPAGE